MVNTFQEAGIRVIMDVVYNHVYNADTHPFSLTVPGYFFRTNSDGTMADGTGCGNDVASERAMARKYIVDSVLYWAREYHLDGFRFDLMGNLDIDTMNAVRKSLSSIDPTIIVLGEGWDLNTPLAADRKATQGNARTLEGVSFFNDTLRDAIKGDTFNSHHGDSLPDVRVLKKLSPAKCWAGIISRIISVMPPSVCSMWKSMIITPFLTSCS